MEGRNRQHAVRAFLSTVVLTYVVFLVAGCGSEQTALLTDNSPKPILQITPYPMHDFGMVPVGSSKTQVFTIINAGFVPAVGMTSSFDLSINFDFEGGDYPGTTGNCGDALDPQEECDMVVVFAPQYASNFGETIRVKYGDGTREWVTDSPLLRGKGIGP